MTKRVAVAPKVERPIELDLDSIKAMRSTTFTAVVVGIFWTSSSG
ncbi:hypothetical protein [Rhizobium leguminosarum]|nr:hypothetical protein [Rhizobium leguminosarum]